jgi:phosphatidylglycerophosphate synthase
LRYGHAVGQYRARDVVSIPGLLSLTRIPLAVAFVFVGEPWGRVAIVAASGLSDLLDGWYARRFGCATPTGAALDPVTDKLFITTVVLTLSFEGAMPWWAVIVLSLRDLAELPLVAKFVVSRAARRARADHPKANLGGKVATFAQFATVAAAMFHYEHTQVLLGVAGVLGVVAAVGYWRQYGR